MAENIQNVVIKYSTDTSGLEQAGKSVDSLSAKEQALKVKMEEATKAAGKGTTATKELGGAMEQTATSTTKTGQALSNLPGPLGAVASSIGKATAAAKAFLATGLGAAIGLLAIGITAVTAAFKSSEAGQNKFAKLMAVISTVTGNLIDLLADLGEKIIWVFENPTKALEQFGELLKAQIINRFTGMLELIPAIGKAVSHLFKGEFTEAGTVAANAVGKVVLGVDNVTESIRNAGKALAEFAAENAREAAQAAKVADMRAKAARLERELLVEQAKVESEISNAREKARDLEQYTAQERRAFLQQALKLEDDLLLKEQQILKLRADAVVLENTFSRTTIEGLNAEAQALADLERIEARRIDARRAVQREMNRLNKEIAADTVQSIEGIGAAEILEREGEEMRKISDMVRALPFLPEIKPEVVENIKNTTKELADYHKAQWNEAYEVGKELSNAFFDLHQANLKNQLANLEAQQERELAMVGDNARARAELEQDHQQQIRQIRIKQAEAEKKQAQFNILIKTAEAIARVLAEVPKFDFGASTAVLVALYASLGAAQLAMVQNQAIPKFAKGVIDLKGPGTGTSDSIPALLSRGESVMTAEETRQHRPLFEAIREKRLTPQFTEALLDPLNIAALQMHAHEGLENINNGVDLMRIEEKLDILNATLKSLPIHQTYIDAQGLRKYIQQENKRTQYLNSHM